MILTPAQRSRIRQGSTSLVFSYDDQHSAHGRPVEGACCVVLDWTEERRTTDHLGNVTVVPPLPVFWIEVTSVKRHKKGGWKVSFDVEDKRERHEYLARGNGYTTSRLHAVDELEVVPAKYQEKLAKDASSEWETVRLERAIAARQEWKRTRRSAQREFRHLRSAA